jgi:hypothetical protein
MPLLHPSGGLVYHLRAWRYSKSLWSGFHAQVRQWLAAWQPEAAHLVLVGPSAGYALDSAWLARYPRLTVLEPDPLARYLLRRRHPGLPLHFVPGTALARPDGFAWLARQFPDAAFLFCNLLGQTLLGQDPSMPDTQRRTWLAGLEPALRGHAWASWHDLASSHRKPDSQSAFQLRQAEPLDAVLGRFWQGGELSIHDHACSGLATGAPREYAIWTLRPGRYHVVEWLACV